MIEEILLKNIATFNELGVQIINLKKINFIYGVNGSGKTVISNFLTNSEKDEYFNCSVKWKDVIQQKTLVYNKKFRDDNFKKNTIAGVFTLGEGTAEDKEVIKNKQAKLEKLRNQGIEKGKILDSKNKINKQQEEEFTNNVWNSVYKKYEQDFKEAFKGHVNRKISFKNELLSQFSKNTSPILPIDELNEKSKTIFGKTLTKIPPINLISFERLLEIERQDIWNTKIIGKADVAIAQLIQRLKLNDWVNKGKEYLQKGDETCPFCQEQTITDRFREELDNYFDESFTKSIQEIKNYVEEYDLLVENLINELSQIESVGKTNKDTKLDINFFSDNLRFLSIQLEGNKNLLSEKVKEPSSRVEIASTSEQSKKIIQIIEKANEQIQKHNNIIKNYHNEKEKLIKSIWRYITEENKINIKLFNIRISSLETEIKNLTIDIKQKRTECATLNGEIIELTKNMTSIQPTVDSINQTLKYFGFLNFEIVPSRSEDESYQIERKNGNIANDTLSEGEITFITFLYFMQLSKGSVNEATISDDRILVVDDPISSLDSRVLFVVSTLLKEVIKDIKNNKGNIKQIILLTHNIYFHKEVSFIDGRTKNDNNTFYWILRKKDESSSIQCYEMENPIHTSYELLWKELKERDNNSGITIQNVMRRIIENYFKILGKYEDDDLIKKFDNLEERSIYRSLICWINDGSHSISDNLFIELAENQNDKYLNVFKKIFLNTGHKNHYDMMMGENENE